MKELGLIAAKKRLPVTPTITNTTNTISSLDKYLKNYGFGSAMPLNTYTNTIADEMETVRKNKVLADKLAMEAEGQFKSITQPMEQKTSLGKSMWKNFLAGTVNLIRQSFGYDYSSERKLDEAATKYGVSKEKLEGFGYATGGGGIPLHLSKETTDKLKSIEQKLQTEAETEKLGWFGQRVSEAAGSLPASLATRIPIVGWAMMMKSSVRNQVDSLEQRRTETGEPLTDNQILISGLGNGALEVGTEMIFPLFGKVGKTVSKTALGSVVDATKGILPRLFKVSANEAGKILLQLPKEITRTGLEEGFEEVLNLIGNGILAKFTTDKDAGLLTSKNGNEALITLSALAKVMTTGFIMGAGTTTVRGMPATISEAKTTAKYTGKSVTQVTNKDVDEMVNKASVIFNKPIDTVTNADLRVLADIAHASMQSETNQNKVADDIISTTAKVTPKEDMQVAIEEIKKENPDLADTLDAIIKTKGEFKPTKAEVATPIQDTTASQTVEHPLPVKSKITTPTIAETVVEPVAKAKTANKVNTMTETNPVKSKVVTSKPLSIAETFEIHSADTKAKTGEYEIIKAGFGGQSKVKINEKVTGKIVGNIGVKSGVLTHIPTGLRIYGGSPYDVKLNAQQSIQVAKYYDTFVSQYSDTPSIIKAFNQQINGKTIRQIFENRIKEYVDNFDNNIKSKKITPVIAEKPQKRVEKTPITKNVELSETEKNIISKLPIGTVVTTKNAETGETQKLSVDEFVKLKGTTISDVKFRRILNGESGAVNNLSYTITEPVKKMTAEAKLSEPTKKLLDTMKKDFIAGKDISSKISEYVKTEEGKTILNDIHEPIDVINKIAELNKAFKVSDKSDVDKLFKFNLQLFAYKKALDDMDGEDTFDERRYLKHILDRVESTSPEDIVKKLTDMFTDSELLYKVYINEKAVETGKERISQSKTPDSDAETLINQLYNEEKIATPDDIVVVNEYLHRLIEKEDLRDFHRVSSMVSILGTKGGQFIQAFRLLGESLPYMQADRQIKELARVIDTPKVDLNKVDTNAIETEKNVTEVKKKGVDETVKKVEKDVEDKTKDIKKEKLSLAEKLKKAIDRMSTEEVKPKKVQSAETKLFNRLVRKAREVIPSNVEINKDNPYEVLAEIVMNRAKYSEVWDDAMKLVEKDPDLSERDSLVEYLNTPTDPITANKYRSLTVMQAIKDMDTPISQLAKDYFLKGNESLDGFIEVLKSNLPNMDEASYKYLEKYVTDTYKEKMDAVRQRAIEVLRKSTMKKDIKKETRNEQEIMIDMLSNAVYYDVFNIETAKDAWAKKLNVPRITKSMSDNITDAMFAIARAKTQEAKDAIYEDMTTKVAAEMTTTKSEKISAWLVTSMLLNPVTLNRNMLSNIGNMMPATLTDILANKLMRIQNVPENMRLYGNERLTMKSNDPIIGVVKKLVTPDLIRRTLAQSDKLTFGTEIQKKKTIFKTRGLENLRKAALQELTTGQLTTEGKLAKLQIKAWGDAYAYQWHFMPAMANRMNVLGYNSATTESEKQLIIDKSIEYATEIATENTYRNRVWIANVLQGISKNAMDTKKIRDLEKKGDVLSLEKAKQERAKGRARQIVIKTVYPFVVTPAAIVSTAYKYSPLAGVSAIAQMVSQKYIKGEYTEAQKVINSRKLSQAIIGTGTQYLVGFIMASLGMLTGAPPQDKKEKEEWALLGKRAYSIYIPGVGSFSIDWLQPLASGLVMGAQIYQNATSKDTLIQKLQGIGYASLDSLLRNTVFDNQTLQLGYNSKGVPDIAWKIATGGILQGLPSVVKRFNKIVDPYVRNVYQGSALKIFTNQFLSGVPFGSFLVEPQVDIWGNKQRQVESKYTRGVIERTFLNMVSPFIVSTAKQDDTTKEVLRVFKETQLTDGNIALPSVPTSKITAKVYGVKKEWDLVGNDYIWLLQRTGELSKQYIDAVINSSGYASMSDSAKAKLFADKYAKAREVARKEYIKNHPK